MAARREIRVPDIGDFDEVEVIEVLVAPGDEIEVETSLVTLESDKATLEVPSTCAGSVVEVRVSEGDRVSEGSVLVVLDVASEADSQADSEADSPEPASESRSGSPPAEPAPEAQPREAAPEPAPEAQPREAAPEPAPEARPREAAPEPSAVARPREAAPEPSAVARPRDSAPARRAARAGSRGHASPSVRRFARELGVDPALVAGTGRKGRILKTDVQTFVKQALAGASAAALPDTVVQIEAPKDIDFEQFGEIEIRPLGRIRRLSAANLHRSWVTVPHVTQHDEADITELEAHRKQQRAAADARGVKLTPLAFLMKAVALVLREFPEFAASLDRDRENLIIKHYIHIGVAVDTPKGLVVPVVRDVDAKDVFEIALELSDLSERARARRLRPADLAGACFSISSLGGIGGTAFTPIINAPEVAILGVSRHRWQPVFRDGEFVPRLMLPLSLSYDHRVIDGAAAVRFTTRLAAMLADVDRISGTQATH